MPLRITDIITAAHATYLNETIIYLNHVLQNE